MDKIEAFKKQNDFFCPPSPGAWKQVDAMVKSGDIDYTRLEILLGPVVAINFMKFIKAS